MAASESSMRMPMVTWTPCSGWAGCCSVVASVTAMCRPLDLLPDRARLGFRLGLLGHRLRLLGFLRCRGRLEGPAVDAAQDDETAGDGDGPGLVDHPVGDRR